jgi:hypothetical protein
MFQVYVVSTFIPGSRHDAAVHEIYLFPNISHPHSPQRVQPAMLKLRRSCENVRVGEGEVGSKTQGSEKLNLCQRPIHSLYRCDRQPRLPELMMLINNDGWR